MLLSPCILWIGLFRPALFPAEPIAFQFQRGRKIFAQGKGIDRTLDEDRAVLGTWFDGRVQRSVEDSIYLSPAMVSRWLGFLSASEVLQPVEVQRKWEILRDKLTGSANFIVHLSAFRKADPLDFDWDRPAGLKNLENLEFSFSYLEWNAKSVPQVVSPRLIATIQAREIEEFQAVSWLNVVSDLSALRPEGVSEYDPFPPLGENEVDYYWVKVPISPDMEFAAKFNLQIAAKRKLRAASFRMLPASAFGKAAATKPDVAH